MSILIGIDIGGSTTKIVGFTPEKELVGTLKVQAADQITCMYGALGHFLKTYGLRLQDISGIVLTGVGASFIVGDIYSIPTIKVPEIEALGRGGLMLSGLKDAIVVSMGTGTAFVRASEEKIEHIGGSGIGGGTLYGLAAKMLHEHDISIVSDMAGNGNPGSVDLLIEDIFKGDLPSLPPELTASNFGKMKSGASDQDIAAALFNLVFQTVGMLSVFACRGDSVKDIVLTGSLAEFPQAAEIFAQMSRLYQVHFIIPKEPVFATAIGAVLSAFTS